MTYFTRTEGDTTKVITRADAMAEVNSAMLDHREVMEMSAGSGRYDIQYKDGRHVLIVKHEGEPPVEDPAEWHGTHSNPWRLHRFDSENRALCNRRIRANETPPAGGKGEWGVFKMTRSEIESSGHSDLYTFCGKCEGK